MNDESLFAAALEKPTAVERQDFLLDACGDDSAQLRRVARLLAADEHTLGILERPPADDFTLPTAPEELEIALGTVIAGRYKILERLGEGGMGTVWLAEQTQPVRRKVALKLVKAGMDSKSVLARFAAERQALALMDHPCIARILDADSTASRPGDTETRRRGEHTEAVTPSPGLPVSLASSGRPFFVMEYVQGLPITAHCDASRLNIAQRLGLFMQVCQAVQHAHSKGILHRDLKPNNILVSSSDGLPVPKVIDFGLAKALDQPLTEQTLHTAHGVMMGTPLYMSPEQAESRNADVDTRADIYALGVILYELLTGTTPIERHRLDQAAWPELMRIITEEEPPSPSTRLGASGVLPDLAAQRRLEPTRLTRSVRGELDWIVMKCLEKDRTRRYETASALGRDIQRYLADEPVEASPPSRSYRLKKFYRRHRGAVLAAALIFLLLMGGIVGTALGLFQARQQRDEAELARIDEAREKDRAVAAEQLAADRLTVVEAQKRRANAALAIANAVIDFLNMDLLGQANVSNQPSGTEKQGRNPKITVRELLDRAEKAIAGKFPDQPLVEAAVRQTLADAYLALGEFALARTHAEQARRLHTAKLGRDDASTLVSTHKLALIYRALGRTTEAIDLHKEVRDGRLRTLGATHVDTLSAMSTLAGAYQEAEMTKEALAILEQVHAAQIKTLGANHPNSLGTLNNLAVAYQMARRPAEVVALFERARDGLVKELGDDHPTYLGVSDNLASAYLAVGRKSEAIDLMEKVMRIRERVYEANHPHILISRSNLANAYAAVGRRDDATELQEKVLAARLEKLGVDHPDTITSLGNLGLLYWDAGQREKAIPLFDQAAAAIEKRKFVHEFAGQIFTNLCSSYEEAGQQAKAEPWRRKWLAVVKERAGPESLPYVAELFRLGQNLLAQKKHVDAEPFLRECLSILLKKQPQGWTTFCMKSLVGSALLGQAKHVEAEPLLLQGYTGMKERESQIPPADRGRLAQALAQLVALYEAKGQKDEAAKWSQELERLKANTSPPPPPRLRFR